MTLTYSPTVQQVSQQYKLNLKALDAKVLNDLAHQYANVHGVALAEWQVLAGKIEEAVSQGEVITPGWLFQQGRLGEMSAQIETQLNAFVSEAQVRLRGAQSQAIQSAVEYAHTVTAASLGQAVGSSISAFWAQVTPAVITQIAANTAPGGPVYKLLNSISPQGAAEARDAIVNGVTQGYNPSKVAAQLRDTLNMPLARAQTISRTEMMRSQRQSTLESYQANSDVVQGWIWSSAMDDTTCEVCWGLEGESFETDNEAEAHINCRCTLLPDTVPLSDLGYGADLEVTLPEELDPEGVAGEVSRAGGEIDAEGNATVYHFTTPETRDIIERTGWMKSQYMDNIYFTTSRTSLVQNVTDTKAVMMTMKVPLKDLHFEFKIKGRNEVHFTLPAVKGLGTDVSQWLTSGPGIFSRLPESRQLKILGPSKFRAYKSGALNLRDFIGYKESPTWGRSVYSKSLKELLGKDARKFYSEASVKVATSFETPVTASAQKFSKAFAPSLKGHGGESLTKYTTSDYTHMETYLTPDSKTGGAIKTAPDGHRDIVSLFNNGGPRGAGLQMLKFLQSQGADRLDCFQWLRPVYERAGWRVTGRMKWDDSYAPSDWNYKKFGRPDIVIMEPGQ